MDAPLPPSERMVAQAVGMVSVQADCTIDDAVVLIEQRAQAMGWTVGRVARAVVERSLRFEQPQPDDDKT
jgi:hypothetical protein